MIPFYISATSGGVLSLAGIYNQLEDGFFTCALIIVSADTIVSKVQNIDSGMPLVIAPSMRERWLYQYPDREKINKLLRQPQKVKLKAHPVSMDRYKSNNNNPHFTEPFNYLDFPLRS